MPIDLPPDSLGPKPTKKQMELLVKMATSGATVHVWSGVRMDSGGAYIDYHTEGETNHEKVNQGDVGKFHDWGWLELQDASFKGRDFIVTERARKVIKLGVTRK